MKAPKELKEEWYKKLKESGFEDIEDDKQRIKHSLLKNPRTARIQTMELVKAYFDSADEVLHTYNFKSEMDRMIWEMHCEGKSIREIQKELNTYKRKVQDLIHDIQIKNRLRK